MFNLDQAISKWRQQMNAAGISGHEVLDELENHLREAMEQQIRAGADAKLAFETAAFDLGHAYRLKNEFAKVSKMKKSETRIKQAFFSFAGVPTNYLNTSMNTENSSLEPRWATYTKAATFITPAICIWLSMVVFVLPKLKSESMNAGIALPKTLTTCITLTGLLYANVFYLLCVGALALFLLEWRLRAWPRYRRASLGVGIFAVNTAVLISITMLLIIAVLAAQGLPNH